jgi:hypothetical protein
MISAPLEVPETGAAQDAPQLSVVLRVLLGADAIERCVRALRDQADARRLEVIVPVDAATADALSDWCRSVTLVIPIEEPAANRRLPPSSRIHRRCDVGSARGFDIARAPIIASLEDAAIVSSHWVDAILQAHAMRAEEVIGGPVDVAAGDTFAWAAFLLDFGRYLPPVDAGATRRLSDVNVSYRRQALMSTRHVWEDAYNEYLVHGALAAHGYRMWMAPACGVSLRRPLRNVSAVLRERYHWGRIFGAAYRTSTPWWRVAAHLAVAPAVPMVMSARVARIAGRHPEHRTMIPRALPQVFSCALAWAAGEVVGQVTGRPF